MITVTLVIFRENIKCRSGTPDSKGALFFKDMHEKMLEINWDVIISHLHEVMWLALFRTHLAV